MKTKILLRLSVLTLIASCSSSGIKPVPLSATDPDYIVRERNYDPIPSWFQDFSKWKAENDGRGYLHFLGESGEVSERISGCELSTLMAKKKIAEQLDEIVAGKMAVAKEGQLVIDAHASDDQNIKQSFESLTTEKSLGFLSGVEEVSVFWERRDYSKTKGNPRVYNCSILVRISERDFKAAVLKIKGKSSDSKASNDKKENKSLLSEVFKD